MHDHPDTQVIQSSRAMLQTLLGDAPPTAIVLGSGLGAVVDAFENPQSVASTEVGFPQSTVSGHAGRIVTGTLGGAGVVAVSGRVHLYEGLPPSTVVHGVRALAAWGVKRIVFTASVGGITEGLEPGELMLVTDHLNLQGVNPLFGPAYGVRFPDLSSAYDPAICDVLRAAAVSIGVALHEGIYAAMPGPSYETPAEVRMLRLFGADVVGMSTVPEVIAANAIGFPAGAIAVVSNRAAGLASGALHHGEVTENANLVASKLAALFSQAVSRFP